MVEKKQSKEPVTASPSFNQCFIAELRGKVKNALSGVQQARKSMALDRNGWAMLAGISPENGDTQEKISMELYRIEVAINDYLESM